eukprot:6211099-Pleurochrysis_carterae.AAC.1
MFTPGRPRKHKSEPKRRTGAKLRETTDQPQAEDLHDEEAGQHERDETLSGYVTPTEEALASPPNFAFSLSATEIASLAATELPASSAPLSDVGGSILKHVADSADEPAVPKAHGALGISSQTSPPARCAQSLFIAAGSAPASPADSTARVAEQSSGSYEVGMGG